MVEEIQLWHTEQFDNVVEIPTYPLSGSLNTTYSKFSRILMLGLLTVSNSAAWRGYPLLQTRGADDSDNTSVPNGSNK